MKGNHDIKFIEDLLIGYLPFIQSIIRQYDIGDEKNIHQILNGIIDELLDNEMELKSLTNKDFCTVYILYTTKGVIQRHQNKFSPKNKIFNNKHEHKNLGSIFSQFSQYELDLIIYKEFMGYSNYKIGQVMGVSQRKIKSEIRALEMTLAKTIAEEMENEELL